MTAPYLGYPSEDAYHEHYTLAGMLERPLPSKERANIKRRLREIERNKVTA